MCSTSSSKQLSFQRVSFISAARVQSFTSPFSFSELELCPAKLRLNLIPRFPHRVPTKRITMGIKGLTKLLGDNAPGCSKPQDPQQLFGRKIAIDASMCIYQLLVAVRMGADNLTNDDGTVTSHLSGLFYRTIRLLELGIKPVYVFDGKPPTLKAGELQKRTELKKAAEEAAQKAKEEGDLDAAARFSRRVNRVTPEMIAACKRLLGLMGIPIVNAPCEAEAQCAELVKKGLVYATASEDMDSLTFGTEKLVRQLWAGTASTAVRKGIKPTEFTLSLALQELDLDMSQFIDLCILCGCDYVDGIKGVGVVKALSLIRKYKGLGEIIGILRNDKAYTVPEEYPVDSIRDMFVNPEVTDSSAIELKWVRPKVEELKKFLVEENQFDVTKIENGIKRLEASKKVTNQVRVDSFFTRATPSRDAAALAKRKVKALPPKSAAARNAKAKGKRSGSIEQEGGAKKKAKTK